MVSKTNRPFFSLFEKLKYVRKNENFINMKAWIVTSILKLQKKLPANQKSFQ
jgi:hypothetical protein